MTARLAVFGNPVTHSQSPAIHQAFAAQAGISLEYLKLEPAVDEFLDAAKAFLAAGALGFNVTVPFKRTACGLVEELSDRARQVNAVNTVYRTAEGRLVGDSTDGGGLVNDMTRNLGWDLKSRRVLVLGAGGASRSVVPALLAAQVADVVMCNRSHDKAAGLASGYVAQGEQRVRAMSANDTAEPFDVVVNGTSAGLGGALPLLPGQAIGPQSHCYDMVYGPASLPFQQACRAQGAAQVSDGLGMLVEQAALAFSLWFSVTVDTRPVIETLRARVEPRNNS